MSGVSVLGGQLFLTSSFIYWIAIRYCGIHRLWLSMDCFVDTGLLAVTSILVINNFICSSCSGLEHLSRFAGGSGKLIGYYSQPAISF